MDLLKALVVLLPEIKGWRPQNPGERGWQGLAEVRGGEFAPRVGKSFSLELAILRLQSENITDRPHSCQIVANIDQIPGTLSWGSFWEFFCRSLVKLRCELLHEQLIIDWGSRHQNWFVLALLSRGSKPKPKPNHVYIHDSDTGQGINDNNISIYFPISTIPSKPYYDASIADHLM